MPSIIIEARTVTEGSRDGDQFLVNGAVSNCGADVKPASFAADASKEKRFFRIDAGKTSWKFAVNLERVRDAIMTRLGAATSCATSTRADNFLVQRIMATRNFASLHPKEAGRYLVFKGSVSAEGISPMIAE